LPCNLS